MPSRKVDKAVVLAAGKGTRMRRPDRRVRLSAEQGALADAGLKTLIPVGAAGRPFLDYLLAALAEAGIRRVCLVVAPSHDELRAFCERHRQLSVELAVQAEPRGTADAMLAAREFVNDDPFLLLNSDNYYPPEVLRLLGGIDEPGVVGFLRERLLARSGANIPAERIAQFAILRRDTEGYLISVVEKPEPASYAQLPEPVLVSMNCWRFAPSIFRACRAIEPSSRGELELTAAVQASVDRLGVRYRVLVSEAPVLDLSRRDDIPAVAELLGER